MTGLVLTDEASSRPSATSCSRSATSASTTIRRARLGEQMQAALYLNHPYGRPMIGWRHEIEDAQPRGRARLLPALLHAQQRDPGGRRRRHRRRGQAAGRGDLRQGRARVAEIGPRVRPQEPPQAPRARDARRPARRSSRACSALYLVPSVDAPPRPARPRRSKCWRICSAAARTAGSIARWWWTAARGQCRRLVLGHRARRHAVRRLRHRRSRASRSSSSKTRSTP